MAALNDRQRAFLAARRFGVLATVDPDGAPQLTVMWYELDGDEILFNTAWKRRKPANLDRDPRVSLVVHEEYAFVRVVGRARLTATGAEALRDIERLAVRYEGAESAARQMASFRTQSRLTYRFGIGRVYSSSELRQGP